MEGEFADVDISGTGLPPDYSAFMESTGVDFSDYRDNTIKRRLARRMALCHVETLAEYVRFMEKNRSEIDAFYRDILINVTCFFRDPQVFEAL